MTKNYPADSVSWNKKAYFNWRPEYPPLLRKAVLDYHLGGNDSAVDLGAGMGASANLWVGFFRRVVLVEPDPNMLRHVKGTLKKNAILARAEEASLPNESADLISCANSFYWMDGPKVLHNAANWARIGGTFAAFRYGFPRISQSDANSFLREQLDRSWNSFRSSRLVDENFTLNAIECASCWHETFVKTIPNVVKMSPLQLAGFLASTSYVNAFLATMKIPEHVYLETLSESLGRFGQAFDVDFALELVMARNKGHR